MHSHYQFSCQKQLWKLNKRREKLKASVKASEINQDNQQLRGKSPREKKGRPRWTHSDDWFFPQRCWWFGPSFLNTKWQTGAWSSSTREDRLGRIDQRGQSMTGRKEKKDDRPKWGSNLPLRHLPTPKPFSCRVRLENPSKKIQLSCQSLKPRFSSHQC